MNANRSMTLIGAAIAVTAAGSSGTATAGIDGSGIVNPESTVSRGTVSGFGSIYVSGVRYNTDAALFLIDGALGSEADLSVGQIVSVLGTVNDDGMTGTAHLVLFEDVVEGPVSSIGSDRLVVMGQTVLVDADTVFDLTGQGYGLDSLHVDDVVEVSGHVDSEGRVVATSIRPGNRSGEFDLTGTIDAVDPQEMRFTINGLAVDYRSAGLFGLGGGWPRAGDAVEIIGSDYDASGAFVAARIYGGGAELANISGVEADVNGVITGFPSLTEFDLGGTRVRLTWDTEYVNDWIFGLSRDRKVRVKGIVDDGGILVADEIVFEKLPKEALAGRVDAIAGDYLVVNSRLVRVLPDTKYRDDSETDERRFNIDSVRAGDRVEIRGHGSADALNATLLRRVDDDDYDHTSDDD